VTRIAVCAAQVPFVRGGAEFLVHGLVAELERRGHRAECVSVPFKWYPKEELPAQAAAWRLVDLSEANGAPIDLAIATKFPTYFVRHPNKVTWLLHQYRAIYDLVGTPYSEFTHEEADVRLRDRLIALDTEVLAESRRLYSIARNVSARLARYNGLAAEALYHPPPLADRLRPGPFGDYVLSVGRLEANKRVDLAIEAITHAGSLRLVVAGDGPRRPDLEQLAAARGLGDRVAFAGNVDADALAGLYAGALAVVYPPFDEDYGYVTLEAFLAGKPVATTADAGGPLEFVRDGVNGAVTEPSGPALGAALERLAGDRAAAKRLGQAGEAFARGITWDGVIDRLLS
jgi:glycosyltransferase involved in cell wall biosynthesis